MMIGRLDRFGGRQLRSEIRPASAATIPSRSVNRESSDPGSKVIAVSVLVPIGRGAPDPRCAFVLPDSKLTRSALVRTGCSSYSSNTQKNTTHY